MSHPNPEKGARYLRALDEALCNGNWNEVPELARKTDKHAPERKCITLTARSETQVASASHRPTSASSAASSSIHSLGDLIPKLNDAISTEKKHVEDSYCASVCLAEIYWLREDTEAALKALPANSTSSRASGASSSPLGWLEVCDIKAILIKTAILESSGKQEEARDVYLSAITKTPGSRTPELRKWTERLLARACMFMYERSTSTPQSLSEALRCFTTWADFFHRTFQSTNASSGSTSRLDVPRRQVWRANYDLLSRILRQGLIYNPTPISASDLVILLPEQISEEQLVHVKLEQRNALKRVEANYESLLLNETQFPKASQSNTEVEEWVEQVIANWNILSGSDWTDAELGAGGRESISRGVLDILYRAATKTFHSTAILRQLFTVHAALAEFDLAMHAFNSYVEIVSKGRARAEKTGRRELSFDSDDTAILTSAEAVRVLCRYGDREQAEKATEIAKTIQSWLGEGQRVNHGDEQTNGNGGPAPEEQTNNEAQVSSLQPDTLATAYRAIGMSQAHWSRLTYEADSRSKLQDAALANLQKAQAYGEGNVETGYALALLLAERRDVSAATQVITQTIASPDQPATDGDTDSDEFGRQRQLIPIWHLLALCLTARDDYEQGLKMCEAAFDQFGDSSTLFGDGDPRAGSLDSEKSPLRLKQGLVDRLEGMEKESIIQIKMSELTFVELMEGAEAAVDVSHELLSLYARLFGKPDQTPNTPKPPPTAASAAPSKIGGTLRSLAGSIRPKSARTSVEKDGAKYGSTISLPQRNRATTTSEQNGDAMGVPISITVTNEDGVPADKPQHKHLPFKIRGHHGDWREHGNLKSKSTENINEKSAPAIPPIPRIPEDNHEPSEKNESFTADRSAGKSESRDTPESPEQPLKKVEHNIPHDTWPPPPGHENQPPRQDVRLPAPHPSSFLVPNAHAPSVQDRQLKTSLLVKIWLFIAGLYLRADLVDDAAQAVQEATQLVESSEIDVGGETSSAIRFFEKRWGGGHSVDELWADVHCVKSSLSLARELPFEALAHYEKALAYFPDHGEAIVGISNILMDIYEEKIPAEEPQPSLVPANTSPLSSLPQPSITPNKMSGNGAAQQPLNNDPKPADLNRLACRDRAYMLLTTLTRLGTGWDDSEAWYTLARAHELSKQVEKAKQALWWVVELEENKPMRPWCEVGGFTL